MCHCPRQRQVCLHRPVIGGCMMAVNVSGIVSAACCCVSPTGAACCCMPLAIAACCCLLPNTTVWWRVCPITTLTCRWCLFVPSAMVVVCDVAPFLRFVSVQTDGACPPMLVLRSAPDPPLENVELLPLMVKGWCEGGIMLGARGLLRHPGRHGGCLHWPDVECNVMADNAGAMGDDN